MFERRERTDRCILVQPAPAPGDAGDSLAEFRELALSAGVVPVEILQTRAERPRPATFIGSGKLEEIKVALSRCQCSLVLVNHFLTPAQERNLERTLEARVLDRTTLILDIFAQRARTHEGKLQVELAQLRHLSTRLVRGWTHLERQKGGIGLRGPGETQLETDRRLLTGRIRHLHARLEKVRKRRDQSRRRRKRRDTFVVALVGYTNAGKSTLFNALTGAEEQTANRLFATLDPTLRRLNESDPAIVLADTVGFIRDLPHELIAAFRATLEETLNADLLLHVVDAGSERRDARTRDVSAVLEDIGAGAIPELYVYNKIDLHGKPARIDVDDAGEPQRVWVSASTGEGLPLLKRAIVRCMSHDQTRHRIDVPPQAARLHARLHALGCVLDEHVTADGGWRMDVSLHDGQLARLGTLGGEDGRISRQLLPPPGIT